MYNFDEIIDRRHTNALNTDGFRQLNRYKSLVRLLGSLLRDKFRHVALLGPE